MLLLLSFRCGAPMTKEYTHRYSMMHRRLTTAGVEVASHYHQLLVLLGDARVSCEPGMKRIMQKLVWSGEGSSSTWHADDTFRTGCSLLNGEFGNG